MKKPKKVLLTAATVDSLEHLLGELPLTLVGGECELGARWLRQLIDDWKSPRKVEQRRREAERVAAHRRAQS